MAELRSVVLAGGDGRAHLPAARVRRLPAPARPGPADHLRRQRQGPGEGAHPGSAATSCARCRPTSCPARSTSTWPAPRPGCCARCGPARAVLDDVEADVVVGFGGYVAVPAYLAAWRRQDADRDPRGQRAAGRGQPARHALHQARRRRLPAPAGSIPAAGATPGGRRAAAAGDRHPRPGRERARARAHFGLDPDRPTLFVFGASAGRPARSTWRWPARRRRSPRAGVQVLHVIGARNEPSRSQPDLPAPYVTVPLHRGDGARLRRGRPGAGPGRRDDTRRGDAVGCRPSTSRCRTATASSGATRCPWSQAGGGLHGRRRRPDPGVDREDGGPAGARPARGWPR